MVMMLFTRKSHLPEPGEALPGREAEMMVPDHHDVLGNPLKPPFPEGLEQAVFGMGCFWGAERVFWEAPGVYTTAVGYAGGQTPNATYEEVCSGRTGHTEAVLVVFDPRQTSYEAMLRLFWETQPGVFTTAVGYAGGMTPNPTYEEVCSGRTGHNEVVLVVYRPDEISYDELLARFWESHDPTQGMRQGNDVGTQYRSAIYATSDAQRAAAEASRDRYQEALTAAGRGEITTEILPAPDFYYAEDYHQQYLAKNPGGYCGVGGTGVSCPVGTGASAA